jgi:hypothetical protein
MMPTVNIPGLGSVEKKYVYIGAAGIAGFVGFMYYRSRQTGDATTSDTTTDPTTDPTAFDPGASDFGAYGYDLSGSTPTYQAPVNQIIPVTSDQQITTDAAWDSAAVSRADEIGVEGGALASALGRFLAGLCLTESQADMVRSVEGLLGRPPQSPTKEIHICAPSGGGGSTAPPAATPTGFKVVSTTKSQITVTWTPVSGAQMYLIHIGGGPQKFNHTVSDSAPPYTFGALSKNSTYTFNVKSVVGGSTSPASATVSGKTKSR